MPARWGPGTKTPLNMRYIISLLLVFFAPYANALTRPWYGVTQSLSYVVGTSNSVQIYWRSSDLNLSPGASTYLIRNPVLWNGVNNWPTTGWTTIQSTLGVVSSGTYTFGGVTFDRMTNLTSNTGVAGTVVLGGVNQVPTPTTACPLVYVGDNTYTWANGIAPLQPQPGIQVTIKVRFSNRTFADVPYTWSGCTSPPAPGTVKAATNLGQQTVQAYALPGVVISPQLDTVWLPDDPTADPIIAVQGGTNVYTVGYHTEQNNPPPMGSKVVRVYAHKSTPVQQYINLQLGTGAAKYRIQVQSSAVDRGQGEGVTYYEFTMAPEIVAMIARDDKFSITTETSALLPAQTWIYQEKNNDFQTLEDCYIYSDTFHTTAPPSITDKFGGEHSPGDAPIDMEGGNNAETVRQAGGESQPVPQAQETPTPPTVAPSILQDTKNQNPGPGSSTTFPGQSTDPNPSNIAQGNYDSDKATKEDSERELGEKNADPAQNGADGVQAMVEEGQEQANRLSGEGQTGIPSDILERGKAPIPLPVSTDAWGWLDIDYTIRGRPQHIDGSGQFLAATPPLRQITLWAVHMIIAILIVYEVVIQTDATFRVIGFSAPKAPKFAISIWGFSDGGLISWIATKVIIWAALLLIVEGIAYVIKQFWGSTDLTTIVPQYVLQMASWDIRAQHAVQLADYFLDLPAIFVAITTLFAIHVGALVKRIWVGVGKLSIFG